MSSVWIDLTILSVNDLIRIVFTEFPNQMSEVMMSSSLSQSVDLGVTAIILFNFRLQIVPLN